MEDPLVTILPTVRLGDEEEVPGAGLCQLCGDDLHLLGTKTAVGADSIGAGRGHSH